MRHALALSLVALLLGGCASNPADRDISGTWINQVAIDAASKGGPLREALQAYGPNLEWDVNTKAGQARYTNGFENVEGKLLGEAVRRLESRLLWQLRQRAEARWQATEPGRQRQRTRAGLRSRTRFRCRTAHRLGASFERALYSAYMGGSWKIVSGPGEGNTVQFQADGQVTGLPGADRYALCLAGDCASMSGGNDSMWLQQNGQGNPWIFARKGKELEILQAVNTAQADEMPQFTPGDRKWLLEKQ